MSGTIVVVLVLIAAGGFVYYKYRKNRSTKETDGVSGAGGMSKDRLPTKKV